MSRGQGAWLGFKVHLVSIYVHQAAQLSVHTMLTYSFAEAHAKPSVCGTPKVELFLFMAGNRQSSADHICDLHCPIKNYCCTSS